MWILFSLISAVLTGFVPILAGGPSRVIGAEKSAICRAAFVLIGSGILVTISKAALAATNPSIFLIFALAGFFDAAAWLFFYRALSDGFTEDAVIQEKSCVPMSILLSAMLTLALPSFTEWAAIALFAVGIFYSVRESLSFLPYLSAICSAIQMQISKVGIEQIGSQEGALFLRSIFSLIFLLILASICHSRTNRDFSGATSASKTALLLSLSGVCAFFAWSFCFSALEIASAAKVQAISKLNFWITAIFLSIRNGGINRRHWFAYAALTVGSLVVIA